jgi:repressor LexA
MLEKNQHPQSQRPLSPSLDTYQKVATAMGISLDDIISLVDGDETVRLEYRSDNYSDHKESKGVRIPVLGRVVAGVPIDAYEEILDYEEILPETAADGEYFGLRVSGDSMEPKFSEGDVVIVRQQSDADSGDIVIALVNGSDATIKRLIKYAEGGIALVASNPTYAPLRFTEAEISSKPVQIVGKVVELRAKF